MTEQPDDGAELLADHISGADELSAGQLEYLLDSPAMTRRPGEAEATTPSATDITVRTRNPEYLDQTIQQLPGAAVVVDGTWDGDTCLVRVFGDPGFLKFAITNQGYGEIVEPGRADAEVFE